MKNKSPKPTLCIGARSKLMSVYRHSLKHGFRTTVMVWDTRIPSQPFGWPVLSASGEVVKHNTYAALIDTGANRKMASQYGWKLLGRTLSDGTVLLKGQHAPKPKPTLTLEKKPQPPRRRSPAAPAYGTAIVHI